MPSVPCRPACLNNKPLKRTYGRKTSFTPNSSNTTPTSFVSKTAHSQYNEYKKTMILDLSSTPEKRKYDDDELFDEAIKVM